MQVTVISYHIFTLCYSFIYEFELAILMFSIFAFCSFIGREFLNEFNQYSYHLCSTDAHRQTRQRCQPPNEIDIFIVF